ncbi:MAG: pyridoxal 5'-phosphate synthase glutaminase subunit PdxT [Patescibacteria group bacterium]
MVKKSLNIGILAFHGDVIEHEQALKKAGENLKINLNVIWTRTKKDLENLDGLVIPGGESTTMQKLCDEAKIFNEIKKIKNIFGTCAGAILLAKKVLHKTKNQKTFELMNIKIDRNAYGTQSESFEEEIETKLGNINAVFIRAPKIKSIGKNVAILAEKNKEILACEEKIGNKYYLATCFHPEFTSPIFHEHFLKHCL